MRGGTLSNSPQNKKIASALFYFFSVILTDFFRHKNVSFLTKKRLEKLEAFSSLFFGKNDTFLFWGEFERVPPLIWQSILPTAKR